MHIPTNWKVVKLGYVIQFIRGVSFPKDAKSLEYETNRIACLRTANVQKEVDWENLWFIDKSYVKNDDKFIKVGDILISTANSLELLGKVSLVKEVPYNATLGTFIVNIRVLDENNNKFIYYYLTSREFINQVQQNASTTTNISNISVGKLEKLNLKLPPLPTQHRIVEKIEELFSELENGVESLKKAKEQIGLYKQSVLKAAFRGELVKRETADVKRDWAKGSRQKAEVLKAAEPGGEYGVDGLPVGWRWVKLEDIVRVISGFAFKSKLFTNDGVPVVKISNIGYSQFVEKNQEFLPYEYIKKHNQYIVYPEDLLIALTRPITNNTTKVCYYPSN